jgi:hypothetical protein
MLVTTNIGGSVVIAPKILSRGRGAAGFAQWQGGVYTLEKQATKPLPTLPKE